MPKNSKVARCVQKVQASGKSKVSAIKVCQASTGQAYKTGSKSKAGKSGRKVGGGGE